jgi:PTS system nitrogen regulatory IIA component
VIDLGSIVSVATTRAGHPATSKKRALQDASEFLAATHSALNARDVFDELITRERLGSTGLGEGVAIPHCRLDSANVALGALVRLAAPVDFDSPDGVGVDLMFTLVVPSEGRETHLQILAELARVFSDADNRARLRAADTDDALLSAFRSMLHAPQ